MASALKIGKNVALKLVTTVYKSRGVKADFSPVEADATASGDDIDVMIPIRATGSVTGQVFSTDYNLLSLVGSVVSAYIMDDTTTILGPFDAVVGATFNADTGGMVTFDVSLKPQTLPSQYTALAAI